MATQTKTAVLKPVTKTQHEKALEKFAAHRTACAKIIAKSEERIAKEMEKRAELLGTMPAEMEADFATVQRYCEENREGLFGNAQSVETPYGCLTFRKGKHAVTLAEGKTEAELIVDFKKKDLQLYISSKESIAKNKLLADREVPELLKKLKPLGVSFEQGETFDIV